MNILWTVYNIVFILIQLFTLIKGQSTTASYFQSDTYLDNIKYPRSKYYYFFTPRSQVRELIQPTETETETLIEDRGYDSSDEGYQAHWPSKVIHQQPIHVHHTVPQTYHKEKGDNHYLLPLLLLALLPLLIGALVLLPLLFSFLTNVLQLLALLQQTLQNLQNNNNNTGRRKRSDKHINPIILTTVSSLVDKYIASQQKYADIE